MPRANGRATDQLRPVTIEADVARYAEGSALIRCGHTHVLCCATVEERVPPFLRGSGQGWITAEYSMLPRATHKRSEREATRGRQGGRTLEIQRLIGRALRSAVDLKALGERTITVDCDVLQADGGTRCASITGGYVALARALARLDSTVPSAALGCQVAAVSVGLGTDGPLLDLDYDEDSSAIADLNVVLTSAGGWIEVQGTAEQHPVSREQLNLLLDLGAGGIAGLFAAQRQALGG